MLLANNRVSLRMKDSSFFIYRIHDKPELERMEKLQEFLKLLGYQTQLVDQMIPVKELQRIIKESEGTANYDTLQTAIVRSMQKSCLYNPKYRTLWFSIYRLQSFYITDSSLP